MTKILTMAHREPTSEGTYRPPPRDDLRPPSAKRGLIANTQLSPVSRPRVWLK